MAEKKLNIHIAHIEVPEFFYKEPEKSIIDNFNRESLFVGIGLHFEHDFSNRIFTVRVSVDYEYDKKNDKNRVLLMRYIGRFDFFIEDMHTLLNQGDESFAISEPLMNMLVGTAVSSSRGILAERMAGSAIHKYYLPLINVSELLADYESEVRKGSAKGKKHTL